jgi:hypothetical protein
MVSSKKKKIVRSSPLVNMLRNLEASGSGGFEGLLRDLFAKVTGLQWRLLKSGHQNGADMIANTLTIAVEAKRYQEGSRLGLDELMAKLLNATRERDGLDLWVLATTREISADDAKALRQRGEEEGVAVEILDHPDSEGQTSWVGILCGAGPEIVERYISLTVAARTELKALATRGDLLEELRCRLMAADVCYDATRQMVTSWLRDAMRDRMAARSKIGSYADLLANGQKFVRRQAVEQALDTWWQEGPTKPAVLLGDEGTGKTWSALTWWHCAAGVDGAGMPLTLVIPAHKVAQPDPVSLLAESMHCATALRSTSFWQKRLRRWIETPKAPRILLVIDGLNQAFSLHREWTDLLTSLQTEPWKGKVAVIMTCRPDHWKTSLNGLPTLNQQALEIQVGQFTAAERDELIKLVVKNRLLFDERVLQLMLVPRLCRLALQWHNELAQSGDITPERLIAIDWQHRLQHHGESSILSLEEFNDFIVDIGQSLRVSINSKENFELSRANLITRLGRDSGAGRDDLYTTVSEVIDGGWLKRTHDNQHRFAVDKSLTPFALAMALVRHLQKSDDAGSARYRLADFMDPLRGQDFAVQILSAACTVALFTPSYPEIVVETLLDQWISERNFGPSSFESYWRLATASTKVFLDQAERFWLAQKGEYRTDEILIKSISAAARQDEDANHTLQNRINYWLSSIWQDPLEGEIIGEVNEKESLLRKEETLRSFGCYQLKKSKLNFLPELILQEDGYAWAWLLYRAFSILSYLPRSNFTSQLKAWALARSVSASIMYAGSVRRAEWLLRLNNEDAIEARPAILSVVNELQRHGETWCVEAADLLLECLGTEEAKPKRPLQEVYRMETVRWHRESGIVEWDIEKALEWPRCLSSPMDATIGLERHAINPNTELPQSLREKLSQLCIGLAPKINLTGEDELGLDTAIIALSRWAPKALAEYLRKRMSLINHRDIDGRTLVLRELSVFLGIIDNDYKERIQSALHEEASSLHDADFLRWVQVLLNLHGQQAAEQIVRLKRVQKEIVLSSIKNVLATPQISDYDLLKDMLDYNDNPTEVQWWLEYLSCVSLEHMPSGFESIERLLESSSLDIRKLAFDIAAKDKVLAEAFGAGEWTANRALDRNEIIDGSYVLLQATKDSAPLAFAERMEVSALAVLTKEFPNHEMVVDAYGASLKQRLEVIQNNETRTIHQSAFHEKRGAEIYTSKRPDEALRLLHSFMDCIPRPPLFSEWPASHLCRQLLTERPQEAVKLWTRQVETNRRFGVKSNEWDFMPFQATTSPWIDTLRERQISLELANNDETLAEISFICQQSGNEPWLVNHIRTDIQDPVVWKRARGITMAGLLDNSEAANTLWQDIEALVSLSDWLREVRETSWQTYLRNRWARHWLERYLMESDEEVAVGLHNLFVECLDPRGRLWVTAMRKHAFKTLPRKRQEHWNLAADPVNKALNHGWNKNKQVLFGKKLSAVFFWPWTV